MNPQVSVIVPVYQVRPYLERCVDSLLQQSLHEIEIILIDDGSTDGCDQICDRYAALDERVRVVHQKNAGLSAARNVGLDLAQAPYIMFVDSDDWVEPDFCKIPWGIAKEAQVGLVFFAHRKWNGKSALKRHSWPKMGLIQEEDALNFILFQSITIWDKLYARELFNEIRFPIGRYCEDYAVTHQIIHKAGKAFYTDLVLYNYCIREGSITHQNNPQVLKDAHEMRNIQIRDLKRWKYQSLAEAVIDKEAFSQLLVYGKRSPFAAESAERLRTIRGFPHIFSWRQKIMLQVFRLSPSVFDLISILSGKRRP